ARRPLQREDGPGAFPAGLGAHRNLSGEGGGRRDQSRLVARRSGVRESWWGTGALIAASAIAFAAEALAGLPVREWGAKTWAIWAGEWHRLLAPNFIHAGLPHL